MCLWYLRYPNKHQKGLILLLWSKMTFFDSRLLDNWNLWIIWLSLGNVTVSGLLLPCRTCSSQALPRSGFKPAVGHRVLLMLSYDILCYIYAIRRSSGLSSKNQGVKNVQTPTARFLPSMGCLEWSAINRSDSVLRVGWGSIDERLALKERLQCILATSKSAVQILDYQRIGRPRRSLYDLLREKTVFMSENMIVARSKASLSAGLSTSSIRWARFWCDQKLRRGRWTARCSKKRACCHERAFRFAIAVQVQFLFAELHCSWCEGLFVSIIWCFYQRLIPPCHRRKDWQWQSRVWLISSPCAMHHMFYGNNSKLIESRNGGCFCYGAWKLIGFCMFLFWNLIWWE